MVCSRTSTAGFPLHLLPPPLFAIFHFLLKILLCSVCHLAQAHPDPPTGIHAHAFLCVHLGSLHNYSTLCLGRLFLFLSPQYPPHTHTHMTHRCLR
ncbi:hypothetical protein AND_004545 [Anopheles darlingi]|uniref:Uncharacterized protein n=1 Tax=Anopheles darlingi TaxID=43151 RepID=W5JLE4_ANODA|nr:hypothetical protein AND_004545 [Anopheles darlingi]